MAKAKRFLATVITSMAAGVMIGMLYAPDKGTTTRRRINRLKRMFIDHEGDLDYYDRMALEELSGVLRHQLAKIDERLQDA